MKTFVQACNARPLIPAACLLVLSLWIARRADLQCPPWCWWWSAFGALAMAWGLRRRVAWSVAAAVVVVAAVSGALMQAALHPVRDLQSVHHRMGARDGVLCEGVVAGRPERLAERARLLVTVERCRDAATMTPTHGRVLLYADTLPAAVEQGMRVRFRASLHPPTRFLNPGTETYGLKWEAEGVVAVGTLADPQWIAVVGDAAGPVLRGLRTWRQAAERAMAALPASPAVIGVLRAMILGQGDALEQLWWETFRRIGVIHLLVVSGLHIGAVALVLYAGLGWLGRRSTWLLLRVPVWRVAAGGAIAGSWGYTWLTGANIPAQRSAWFVTILFAGILLDRRHDLWSALALSVVVLLVASPLILWLPSFQLTFAAVAAIAAYESLRARRRGPHGGRARGIWSRLLEGAGVTLAATIGVTPIVAWHFHETSLMGLVTNLVLVPLVSLVITPIGLVFIVLAPLSAGLGAVVGAPLVWLTAAFTHAAQFVDHWSGPWQLAWVPFGSELVCWYVAWGRLFARAGKAGRSLKSWSGITLLCLALGWVTVDRVRLHTDHRLRVTFLDVGQGSAAVVRFPNGRVYMIDGGGIPRSTFDLGRWVVAPALRRLHVPRVDRLIMTHYHPDHYPGFAYVAETFGPQRLDVNGSRANPDDPQWVDFSTRIARTGVLSHTLNTDTAAWNEGDVELRVLHPGPPATLDGLSENDRSIVLEITHGKIRLLFTGDIETATERALLGAGRLRPVDLVVAPHHGSDTSSTPPWVRALQPRVAVISCGRHNRYGFPRASILRTYAAVGTQLLRTDRHGAVTAISDGKTLRVYPFVDLSRHPR